MGILDEVGKKVASVGQKAVSDTKNLVETARLSDLIKSKQQQVAQLLQELGTKVFDTVEDSDEVTIFPELIAAIKQERAQIISLSSEVARLRGEKNCPKCGKQIPAASVFCPACGESLGAYAPPPAASQNRTCSNCGAAITADSQFCTSCGAKQ
jgi:RNA polymerase subunit RPABC4/transcription elongation factor Spt4